MTSPPPPWLLNDIATIIFAKGGIVKRWGRLEWAFITLGFSLWRVPILYQEQKRHKKALKENSPEGLLFLGGSHRNRMKSMKAGAAGFYADA
jgi:hypothetical protein